MGAEHLAVGGDQGALAHAEAAGEEAAGIAVGDEADVVGVGLGGHRQAARRRLGPDGGLGRDVAEREERPRQAFAA